MLSIWISQNVTTFSRCKHFTGLRAKRIYRITPWFNLRFRRNSSTKLTQRVLWIILTSMLCLHRFRTCITEVFYQRIAVSSIQLSQKRKHSKWPQKIVRKTLRISYLHGFQYMTSLISNLSVYPTIAISCYSNKEGSLLERWDWL